MARSRTRTIANKSEIGQTKRYQHPEFDMALRPEVGTQPQFRKRRPPATYRYDSSLSPSLEVGIGMGYLRRDLAEPGTEVEVDVRGRRRPARIESKPLYGPAKRKS